MFDMDKPFVFFSGGKNKTESRKTFDLIGTESIRTRIVTHPDGSTTRYKSRGGFPEAITETRETSGTDYIRGYIANIKSITFLVLEKSLAYILARSGSVWGAVKKTTTFGRYVVASILSDDSVPDLWVLQDGVLRVFTKTKRIDFKLSGTGSGVPLLAIPSLAENYVSGNADADDNHLFILSPTSIEHCPLRAPTAATLYDGAELSDNTDGYADSRVAGVNYSKDALTVGFSMCHRSVVGNILQRARTVQLLSDAPFIALGDWVEHVTQGAVYIYPTGDLSTDVSSGTWLNPIDGADPSICELYQKTGGPYPEPGYYTYVGTLNGEPADRTEQCSATVYTYSGNDGYTDNKAVGWFNGNLSVAVNVSVEAYYKNETSTGARGIVCPVTIAYPGYGSMTEPPATNYKWGPPNQGSTVNAGSVIGLFSSGTTVFETWWSESKTEAYVLGHPLLSVTYRVDGSANNSVGLRYFDGGYRAASGLETRFTDPSVNPYAAQWDAINICVDAKYINQYNPGYFKDQVVVEESDGTLEKTITGETRDYILFDRACATYVYIKGEFSGGSGGSSATMTLVVEQGGMSVSKVLHRMETDSFSWLILEEQAYSKCYYWVPPSPFTGFAPPFCCQGAFPYAAYSEPVDAGGSVMLLSIPLVIQSDPDNESAPAESYAFTPKNFIGVISLGSIALRQAFWSGFSNTKQVINFADGAFADWVGNVYVDASQDSSTYTEVYRT